MRILLLFFIVFGLLSCNEQTQNRSTSFNKSYINQENGYSQIVSVETGGVTTLYVSGQIGLGDDLESQMRSALQNLTLQLEQAGATLDDIVKMNTYIVDYQPEDLNVFRETRKDVMGNEQMPASTLVGVSALALPEWLIEIEAVAVMVSK